MTGLSQKIILYAALAVFLLSAFYPGVGSAAYCSLRDPVTAIKALYPEGTQHRSIVRPVNAEVRMEIAKRLPFTLYYSEIGKHTLYLVAENRRPLGFVQARSERTNWGLVEIAWAIDSGMRIYGMFFQRCRSPNCDETLKEKMEQVIQGMTFNQLRQLLSEDGNTLSDYAKRQLPDSEMSLTILRSALKTIAVIEQVWGDVVNEALDAAAAKADMAITGQ